jgi:FKBP-type peptidyl-prolyl cis-trans isomerase FkpA
MKKIILLLTAFTVCATGFAQTDSKTKTKTGSGKTETKVKTEKGVTKVKAGGEKTKTPAVAYDRTPAGLQYKIMRDVPGKNTPQLGDNVEMHIRTHIGDSILFDSRVLNKNQPVPFQIMPPSFKGDLVEGFMMMTPGDSAIFRVPVDSLRTAGAQLLPWMKSGDMIDYEVALVSVKSAEQMKKDAEAKSAEITNTEAKLFQDYFTKNNLKPLKTASGLYYTITTPGTGDFAKAGQQITVNYTGKTLDGNVFDSNVDPKFNHVQPFSFTLGQRQVIAGWDEGLMLLKKGGKGTLYIPSGLAYGERSPSPAIPANSILVFDVEVTDIATPEAPKPTTDQPGHEGHKH